MSPRAVLFDLDDTLFLEEDFVRSGLASVARAAAPAAGADSDVLLDRLWYDFRRLGRTGVFDRFAAAAPGCGLTVRDMVAIYREHAPDIALPAASRRTLTSLRARGVRLAVVTDGAAATQARKVAALGLADLVDAIVYSWAIGAPKPDPRGFLEACAQLDVAIADAVIVGDDPYHDMAAARAAGLAAIRVRTGRAAEIATREAPRVYAEIASLDALGPALAQLGFPPEGEA